MRLKQSLMAANVFFWVFGAYAQTPTRGIAPGGAIPAFSLSDQNGQIRNFENLKGPNGLMLVFFRSADW